MFSKQNINPDICQVDSKNKLTEVDSKRKRDNISNPNKKSKVIDNSANISNQANKNHESGCGVPQNALDRSKGKQLDLYNKHSETTFGGNHKTYLNDDDYSTLLDHYYKSYGHHTKGDFTAQMSNVGTSAQTPNYFFGESQFNDNRKGNKSNLLVSHNKFFTNKADEFTEDD
uniref:Uncharacterized protein n=1 Tax=Meloidogyne enterolobii TaxID=390850 RepID=A0A6V7XM02_MELEN|nr:unnamed protein product [Meloidogyne enterolobii]